MAVTSTQGLLAAARTRTYVGVPLHRPPVGWCLASGSARSACLYSSSCRSSSWRFWAGYSPPYHDLFPCVHRALLRTCTLRSQSRILSIKPSSLPAVAAIRWLRLSLIFAGMSDCAERSTCSHQVVPLYRELGHIDHYALHSPLSLGTAPLSVVEIPSKFEIPVARNCAQPFSAVLRALVISGQPLNHPQLIRS